MARASTLFIDLTKIEDNARVLVSLLPGIDIVGVTKVTCGNGRVAKPLVIDGGLKAVGDSRHANLASLHRAGVTVPVWLLRGSRPDLAAATVQLADVSLNSELDTIIALDNAAARHGRKHGIVIMVESGDLREGVMPEELAPMLKKVRRLRHVRLTGLGTNLTCYGGVVPTPENLGQLVELTQMAEELVGRRLHISGGNSSTLGLALSGRMPARIDNLRIGESILLGLNTLTRQPLLPELHLDAFVLRAPVIECKVKPSRPFGTIAQDAFGHLPRFVDRGRRRRAICALGRQDATPDGLTPCDKRIAILGASSDQLVLDVDELGFPPRPGDLIDFLPNYATLLQAFTSPYVHKVFRPPDPRT